MRFLMGFLIAVMMVIFSMFILTQLAPDEGAPAEVAELSNPAPTPSISQSIQTDAQDDPIVQTDTPSTDISDVTDVAAVDTVTNTAPNSSDEDAVSPAASSNDQNSAGSAPEIAAAPELSLAPEDGSTGALQAPTASQPVQAPDAVVEVPTPQDTYSAVPPPAPNAEEEAAEQDIAALEVQQPNQATETEGLAETEAGDATTSDVAQNTETETLESEVEIADPEVDVTEDDATIEEDSARTESAEANPTPRLPTIGGGQGSSNLIDRRNTDEDGTQEEGVFVPELDTPFREYATEAEASLLPQIGIILEPEGDLDLDISQVSLPVSILVPGTGTDALTIYEAARENGLEVFVSLRPESPLAFSNPSSADASMRAVFDALPEAIGYVQDPILEVDRATKNTALEALTELGRGYLEFSSGLISGALGGRDNLPSGVIDLGVTGDVTPASISRALDRASLLAAQSGSTVLILPLKQESITALEEFAASQKGQNTALMPVSRIIDP